MAVTTQESVEYAKAYSTTPPTKLKPDELHGRLRIARFVHDQSGAGDATSDVAAVKLPPGRVTVLGLLSSVYVNWTTASATMDVGWDAYTDFDGTAVAADPNGLDDGTDVDTAGVQNIGSVLATAGNVKTFESKDGVVIRFTSQDTAIVDGDDLSGYIVYVID